MGCFPNDDDQFDFIIVFIRRVRQDDIFLVGIQCIIELAEQRRIVGNRQLGFFGMSRVIEADAENFFGIEYGRGKAYRICIDNRSVSGSCTNGVQGIRPIYGRLHCGWNSRVSTGSSVSGRDVFVHDAEMEFGAFVEIK